MVPFRLTVLLIWAEFGVIPVAGRVGAEGNCATLPVQQAYPSLTVTSSTYQPAAASDESLPNRQRNCTDCPAAAAGRFAVVVMQPPLLPDQAVRAPKGFPVVPLRVRL